MSGTGCIAYLIQLWTAASATLRICNAASTTLRICNAACADFVGILVESHRDQRLCDITDLQHFRKNLWELGNLGTFENPIFEISGFFMIFPIWKITKIRDFKGPPLNFSTKSSDFPVTFL